ncbi:MAG: ATP-dependent sacrificial sulfur transferase LarE [Chloroflexi bacterium]|nr:ATP-dependent sacrificial sulfur transferase LarE [Chloroflexota bacterium]
MSSVAVAYSGGVDSTYLAVAAHDVLGPGALAVTAASPALPSEELQQAMELAQQFGFRHRVIWTAEMDDPRYVTNDPRRCYFCKTELYTKLCPVAQEEGLAWTANGTNLDDLGDYRPGLEAAGEWGVRSPLVEAGFTKEDVRQASQRRGLPTWDKPAAACLASRIPYGTPVTLEVLTRIGKAEAFLKGLGFRQVRVRHHNTVARIEVPAPELSHLLREDVRQQVVEHLRSLGYLFVTLDLAGYRTGSLNEALRRQRSTL